MAYIRDSSKPRTTLWTDPADTKTNHAICIHLYSEQQYTSFEQPGPGLQRAATFAFLSGEKNVGSRPRGTSSLAPKVRYLDFNNDFIK